MTEDSLVGKIVLILNQSDLYVGILNNQSPLKLEKPYLLIKKDENKMAVVPHTKEPLVLEGRINLYNEGNLNKNIRFLCYSPRDEDILKKMINGVYD